MRAVQKTGSWGTRRIFRGIRCKKQAFPVRKRYSVPETPFSGTGQARCLENSLVMHGASSLRGALCKARLPATRENKAAAREHVWRNKAREHGREKGLVPENMAKKPKFASFAISPIRR